MAALSKAQVQAVDFLGLRIRIPPGALVSVSRECFVLSGRGFCVGLITRPEEPYTECGVTECDREASTMRMPWPIGGCRALTFRNRASYI